MRSLELLARPNDQTTAASGPVPIRAKCFDSKTPHLCELALASGDIPLAEPGEFTTCPFSDGKRVQECNGFNVLHCPGSAPLGRN